MAVVSILTESEVAERRQRLRLTPEAENLHNVAGQLKNQHKHTAALHTMQRALALCPESPLIQNGMAAILWNLQRFDEALVHAETVMRMEPEDPAGWNNAGLIHSSLGHTEAALRHCRRAVELDPRNLHLQWTLATTLLRAGQWREGFERYECRQEYRGAPHYFDAPYPLWQGEDLSGKSIMVLSEQGSGDRILFSRYLHWLRKQWPTCTIYMIETELDTLLWNFQAEGVVQFLPSSIPWPKNIDYSVWLMSLPRLHGTTPENVYPDPGLIRARITDQPAVLPEPHNPDALKVGIAWRGNPLMAQNLWRCVPLEMLAELQTRPDVVLYSLQQDSDEVERLGYSQTIMDLAPAIRPRGYVGSAIVMSGLDLVITACTSTAHLAGALGVPCLTLLCSDPYWLWLRDGETTPWYPSTRLLRQITPGDWRPVIETARSHLDLMIQARANDRRKTA